MIFLLLVGLAGPVAAQDANPELPDDLKTALARIEKIKTESPGNLDALQAEYLILFENFSHHQEGREGIFALYHLLRRAKRTSEAYAALLKILAVFQNDDKMSLPNQPTRFISLVATAKLEEAHLYATQMNNPLQAVTIIKRMLLRDTDLQVGTVATDRRYYGSVKAVARLHLADCYLLAGQAQQALDVLLEAVRLQPSPEIWNGEHTLPTDLAAIQRLTETLKALPASPSKKARVWETFHDSAITTAARVTVRFQEADFLFGQYREWNNKGAFAQAAAYLRQIIADHPTVELITNEGREPAGVLALRRLRDAELNVLKNTKQAAQTLEGYRQDFADRADRRVLAAYSTLYLAELELDFNRNARAAHQLFLRVAEHYGDVPRYPAPEGDQSTLAEHARLWAERAHQRM